MMRLTMDVAALGPELGPDMNPSVSMDGDRGTILKAMHEVGLSVKQTFQDDERMDCLIRARYPSFWTTDSSPCPVK